MMTIEIPDYVYERMLKVLQEGIDVCYNVDYREQTSDNSPAYVVGYSRATMQEVIEDLKNLKKINN